MWRLPSHSEEWLAMTCVLIGAVVNSPSSAGISHNTFLLSGEQKSPCSQIGNKDRKDNFCGTTLFAAVKRPLCPVPTHRLPVNAGIASEDTLVSHFPLPSAAHFSESLFAPLSALRNSLWMRFRFYSRLNGFKLCYALYTRNVFVCQELFCAVGGQDPQYSRTTPRTMPMISA